MKTPALLLWAGLLLGALTACRAPGGSPSPAAPAQVQRQPSPTPTAPSMQCTWVTAPITPTPPQAYLLPEDHLRGDRQAPVVLLMYGDFQCPGCAVMAQALRRIYEAFPQQVAVAYRHYPLAADNDKALLAVQAAEAAARQGAFWVVHDALYAQQAVWRDLSPAAFHDWLLEQAPAWGLDPQQWAADLDDPALADLARRAWEAGRAAGLVAVPVLFINGELYTGPPDYANLRAAVALKVLSTRQFHRCPPWVVTPNRSYRLTLHTNQGPIVLLLDAADAPQAVNSLVFLAQAGWYDHTPVSRVEPGRAVLLGDPSGTGYGHAGFFFALELSPAMRYPEAGWVGLDNDGPATNDGRFFITLGPRPDLDARFTRVGQVIQGLALLQALPPWDGLHPDNQGPPLWVQRAEVAPSEP